MKNATIRGEKNIYKMITIQIKVDILDRGDTTKTTNVSLS